MKLASTVMSKSDETASTITSTFDFQKKKGKKRYYLPNLIIFPFFSLVELNGTLNLQGSSKPPRPPEEVHKERETNPLDYREELNPNGLSYLAWARCRVGPSHGPRTRTDGHVQ